MELPCPERNLEYLSGETAHREPSSITAGQSAGTVTTSGAAHHRIGSINSMSDATQPII